MWILAGRVGLPTGPVSIIETCPLRLGPARYRKTAPHGTSHSPRRRQVPDQSGAPSHPAPHHTAPNRPPCRYRSVCQPQPSPAQKQGGCPPFVSAFVPAHSVSSVARSPRGICSTPRWSPCRCPASHSRRPAGGPSRKRRREVAHLALLVHHQDVAGLLPGRTRILGFSISALRLLLTRLTPTP